MIAQPSAPGSGPLSAEELEGWTRAEEALSSALQQQPTGQWSLARTKVEAYRNVCGPRLLAQFHALERRLDLVATVTAAELAEVRRQRDELASYVIHLRRWLAEAAASEPPGLGASAEEIRQFEKQLCTLVPTLTPD
jgi:hypothetical protein